MTGPPLVYTLPIVSKILEIFIPVVVAVFKELTELYKMYCSCTSQKSLHLTALKDSFHMPTSDYVAAENFQALYKITNPVLKRKVWRANAELCMNFPFANMLTRLFLV